MSPKEQKPDASPPRWLDKLVERFCAPHLVEEVMGDLHERYHLRVRRFGQAKARKQYWREVLAYARPHIFKRRPSPYPKPIFTDMLRNYFKIAFRNLLSKKFYSAINILGLSIGMTCCMLIFLYVNHELSYDKFHSKADRIYRLVTDIKTPTETIKISITSAPMGAYLKKDFPEVEEVARMYHRSVLLQRDEHQYQEDQTLFADASFFDVFDFLVLRGNVRTALVDPFSVVITEDAAKKYFGEENPIGQSLRMEGSFDLTVTAVVRNVPSNSQVEFDFLISMSTLLEKLDPDRKEEWGNFGFYTFLLLPELTNPEALEDKFPAFMERHISGMREDEMYYSLFLEPLRRVYLYTGRGGPVTGSLSNIYFFSIIAAFILLIACINFMNLATARAAERAKEVGIRKVNGALKRQLTIQFLSESILLSLFAFVLASIFTELLLPAFNELSGKIIDESIFYEHNYLLLLFLLALGVGILAGIYPAFVLSGFQPVSVLKGRFSTSSRGLVLRKALVVVQFAISIMLIAGTVTVYTQLNYMRSQELGFTKEQMLVINFRRDDKVMRQMEAIKNSLKSHPRVLSAAASSSTPGQSNSGAFTNIENPDGEMQASNIHLYSVDFDFLEQYQIEVVAGRSFSRDFPTDSTQAMIINEAAAASYGYASPEEAVGKRFSQWGREGQIIGVIKDFHIRSLQQQIQPLTIRIATNDFKLISLHIEAKDIPSTLAALERQWSALVPHRPFDYFFLDEAFDQQYRNETRFGKLFICFGGLAIFIACLGLLGLISYTVVQRMKEIGIRKVLGASESSIIRLLTKDFLKLVIIAFLIATPIAWYVLREWLADFAYRIEIGAGVFLLAGLGALLIALATVSWQSIRAALANPVDSLKDE
ncbi:MAG: ABC transporter permease [Cyclobacteriaceae bacterium]